MEIAILIIVSLAFLAILGSILIKKHTSDESEVSAREMVLQERLKAKEEEMHARLKSQELFYESKIAEKESALEQMLKSKEQHYQEKLNLIEQAHIEAIKSQKESFEDSLQNVSARLTTITGEMLKQRQAEFAESSQERLDKLLLPLENNLREMRAAVADNNKKNDELSGKLDSNLRTLLTHTVAAQNSADNLAKALRGNNRVQGELGELVLTELLNAHGLTEGRHFHTQVVMNDNGENRLRDSQTNDIKKPDVILHLDNNRELIIDSKVSLSAYLDYVNADNDADRERFLKEHINSLNRHVRELSNKDYTGYVISPKTTVDYVLMFVPNTSALLLATTHSPDLWRKAMEKNVYIADEQTLYAALKIISMTWKQIAQTESQEKVFKLAETLLERVGQFYQSYQQIGRKLEEATNSFNEGKKKLSDEGHSIPVTCRQLVALGAKPGKNAEKIPDIAVPLNPAELIS